MELVDVVEAIAHLSSEIDTLRAEQSEYHERTWEKLEQWSEINAELAVCLQGQAQDNRASTGTYQSLVQHLLTFAHTTQQLTSTTWKLDSSSERLTNYLMQEQAAQLQSLEAHNKQLQISSSQLAKYLIEEQSPQLKSLETNSQQLQTSSSNLENYLRTEQSQRLKLLETSIRTLLEMLEASQKKNSFFPTATSLAKSMKSQAQDSLPSKSVPHESEPNSSPPIVTAASQPKKRSYSLSTVLLSVGASSVCSLLIFALVWNIGGVGRSLASIAQRSEWSITKLERLESALGIEE